MLKEIKTTDRIGDAMILVNDNFKELEERLKKVEKRLKIGKSKRSKK